MTDPFEALRRTRDAAPPRPAFVAELADRLRVELGIREGDEATVMMRTAMGDMPVQGGVPNALIDVIEDQGYAVLENALSASEVGAVRDGLAPYLGEGPFGRNDFEGFRTKRVYSLPAKSRAFDRLIEDERVLDVAGALLGPNFLLTAALAINLGPDESAQDIHYDEAFYYGLPRPRRPLSLSTLWAIDDFTAENGGTLIAPGSTVAPTPPSSSCRSRCRRAPSPSIRARCGTPAARTRPTGSGSASRSSTSWRGRVSRRATSSPSRPRWRRTCHRAFASSSATASTHRSWATSTAATPRRP
jgi:hypothetical protein